MSKGEGDMLIEAIASGNKGKKRKTGLLDWRPSLVGWRPSLGSFFVRFLLLGCYWFV